MRMVRLLASRGNDIARQSTERRRPFFSHEEVESITASRMQQTNRIRPNLQHKINWHGAVLRPDVLPGNTIWQRYGSSRGNGLSG